MSLWKQSLRARWQRYSQRPAILLARLFAGRVFKGGGELGADELDLGIGVVLIFLAMPGTLVSLLMFEKYGSLIRFLRGDGTFDPFTATIPDEYFFIVLSMSVSCAVALWRWNSIFPDRRDYANLVHLPVPISSIFFANLFAVISLAVLLTFVVNVSSFFLFPIAVLASQGSFSKLFRFAFGHAVSVSLSSLFSFLAIFAISGTLMALLPARLFRKLSPYIRFAATLYLLGLFATSLTVSFSLSHGSSVSHFRFAGLPPIWFLGITETLWGNGHDVFYSAMTRYALLALALSLIISTMAYALSFRRSFLRIPELASVESQPGSPRFSLPFHLLDTTFLRNPKLRASFHFVSRTLLRSDAHLQILLAFSALGMIVAGQSVNGAYHPGFSFKAEPPNVELLSIPFILGYCLLLGMRFAFEVPLDLSANWIFKLWIEPGSEQPRQLARRVLLLFSLGPLVPLCLLYSMLLWGWLAAVLQSAIFALFMALVVEILLLKFRKIPFTCTYPPFQSHSPVILFAYFIGFLLFGVYLPQAVQWAIVTRWGALLFLPLLLGSFAALREYRRRMLPMDKELIFEEEPSSTF